eukprot:gene6876-1228_t
MCPTWLATTHACPGTNLSSQLICVVPDQLFVLQIQAKFAKDGSHITNLKKIQHRVRAVASCSVLFGLHTASVFYFINLQLLNSTLRAPLPCLAAILQQKHQKKSFVEYFQSTGQSTFPPHHRLSCRNFFMETATPLSEFVTCIPRADTTPNREVVDCPSSLQCTTVVPCLAPAPAPGFMFMCPRSHIAVIITMSSTNPKYDRNYAALLCACYLMYTTDSCDHGKLMLQKLESEHNLHVSESSAPSQERYVMFFNFLFQLTLLPNPQRMVLQKVELTNHPAFVTQVTDVVIETNNRVVWSKENPVVDPGNFLQLSMEVPVTGDFSITYYHYSGCDRVPVFRVAWSTFFITSPVVFCPKSTLDYAHCNPLVPENTSILLRFKEFGSHPSSLGNMQVYSGDDAARWEQISTIISGAPRPAPLITPAMAKVQEQAQRQSNFMLGIRARIGENHAVHAAAKLPSKDAPQSPALSPPLSSPLAPPPLDSQLTHSGGPGPGTKQPSVHVRTVSDDVDDDEMEAVSGVFEGRYSRTSDPMRTHSSGSSPKKGLSSCVSVASSNPPSNDHPAPLCPAPPCPAPRGRGRGLPPPPPKLGGRGLPPPPPKMAFKEPKMKPLFWKKVNPSATGQSLWQDIAKTAASHQGQSLDLNLLEKMFGMKNQ